MRDPLASPRPTRRIVTGDLVVAGLFGLVAIPVHLTEGPLFAVVTVMVVIALAVRRIAPSLMLALALASAIIQVVSGEVTILPSLAYAVLFHTAGGHSNRWVRWGSLAVGIVGVVFAGVVLRNGMGITAADGTGLSPYLPLFVAIAAAAAVVIGGWATGFIAHQRRTVERATVAATIADLERRRILDRYDEQAERTRLARDMHDVVAHSLAVVIAQAEGARYALDTRPDTARDALQVIAGTARDALGDVRDLLTDLRTPAEDGDGRSDRRRLFDRMRAAGMTLDVREIGDIDAIDPGRSAVVYAVLTESLTNALKYGDLRLPVRVHLERTEGMHLTVDNTVSPISNAGRGAGYGVLGMRERAAEWGGTLTSVGDGSQWSVELTLPAGTAGDR
ncbi:sensor histidine kinase [Millisia brevis]|uniref:sensor histidine kinase n=1 Tax=Millisia brevis TaxID=264148 RepID=UPI00083639CC|nr:histidine kinase [Millisia brevis]